MVALLIGILAVIIYIAVNNSRKTEERVIERVHLYENATLPFFSSRYIVNNNYFVGER